MYLADFISFKFLEGPVIYPNDTLFPSLIIDQNIRVNYTPTVLVYAIDNKDVQKAVKCVVELKRDIVPRSGGHSYEKYGLSGRDNVFVLDLTFVNSITINSEMKTAKIGAGNRLGNVYNQLNQAGFLIPAGLCPSVGIGGHALGGGFGYYSRKYGLACNNIISMEVVDGKGNILHVDSNTNSDLYFALKGAGGGSYGIVTYFVFRIHPTPPQVTYMELAFN
ncbi:FAD-binding domain-containing protein [Gigaspora margarita]|uniref:FAD-binding domain-containing protein n=1 Tax=Gigaspora margarita TaxID=4874 RepID=A0A8H4EJ53_GIGMA|nr:FAD-binding domain-containing protein [Gigaspora margarita]